MRTLRIGYRNVPAPSPTETRLLDAILRRGAGNGTRLATDAGLGVEGVYVILGRMKVKGLVKCWTAPRPASEGGRPLRVYDLSDDGRAVLAAKDPR